MKTTFDIKKVLVPTDLSETAYLALEHAAMMAALFKADLYLLHVIEVTETSYSLYNPAVQIRSLDEIQKIVAEKLEELASRIHAVHGIPVRTLVANGKTAWEINNAVKENDIDIVIMGTHGASGLGEHFIGSTAQRTVAIANCPVITIHKRSKSAGFKNILLPIDNALHSRQKVDFVIELARKYPCTVHIMGLLDRKEGTDLKKLNIKISSIEDLLKEEGIPFDTVIIEANNLAVEALKYAQKVKGDLILTLADHESRMNPTFMGNFAKQIVNHSDIPVMSIKPVCGKLEELSLGAANPF